MPTPGAKVKVLLSDGPLNGRIPQVERGEDGFMPSNIFYLVDDQVHQYQARAGGAYYFHFFSFAADAKPEHYGEITISELEPTREEQQWHP